MRTAVECGGGKHRRINLSSLPGGSCGSKAQKGGEVSTLATKRLTGLVAPTRWNKWRPSRDKARSVYQQVNVLLKSYIIEMPNYLQKHLTEKLADVTGKLFCTHCQVHQDRNGGSWKLTNNGRNRRWRCAKCTVKHIIRMREPDGNNPHKTQGTV